MNGATRALIRRRSSCSRSMTSPRIKSTFIRVFFIVASFSRVQAGEVTTFAATEKEAMRLQATSEGYAYMVKFSDAMDQAVGRALHACPQKFSAGKKEARFQVL